MKTFRTDTTHAVDTGAAGHGSVRTPSQQIIPHEMLLLCEHSHNNQSVQVDSLAKHPEVVAAHQIEMNKHTDLAACLEETLL